MFTYNVSATGPKGFQVSVTGPRPLGTNLIDDFPSLAEAEAFATRMRVIDAGRTFIAPLSSILGGSASDIRTDDLIRRSRALREVAAQARSTAMESEVRAQHLRGQAAIDREFWCGLREIAPGAPFTRTRAH